MIKEISIESETLSVALLNPLLHFEINFVEFPLSVFTLCFDLPVTFEMIFVFPKIVMCRFDKTRAAVRSHDLHPTIFTTAQFFPCPA